MILATKNFPYEIGRRPLQSWAPSLTLSKKKVSSSSIFWFRLWSSDMHLSYWYYNILQLSDFAIRSVEGEIVQTADCAMILSLILSLIGPGNRNKEGQGGGFPSSLFVPIALFILCQLPSHQICNEHPVAVCANTSTWVKEGEGSTSLVDDTDHLYRQIQLWGRASLSRSLPFVVMVTCIVDALLAIVYLTWVLFYWCSSFLTHCQQPEQWGSQTYDEEGIEQADLEI